MFKVGDKDSGFPPLLYFDKIYTIKGSIYKMPKQYYLDETGDLYWNANRFELVESSELEELVKKANEGYKAIDLLFEKYSLDLEIKSKAHDWVPFDYGGDLSRINREIKIKSKVHKFKAANWEAEINGKIVKIGWTKFEKNQLKFDLNAILNANQSGGHYYSLKTTRTGIYYEGSNFISYDDAEKLLKELEK